MSRKKINVYEPLLGVHRAEWFRLASDVPTYLYDYLSENRCIACSISDCPKCERCVLNRVEYLIKLRRSKFIENLDV